MSDQVETNAFLNLPGSQVELIPGSSSDFMQLLTDLAVPEKVSSLLPITPYLVIAKNKGTATTFKQIPAA
jgi:hypothetical protein